MQITQYADYLVLCPEMEALTGDPRQGARVWDGVAFCAYCGATDHETDRPKVPAVGDVVLAAWAVGNENSGSGWTDPSLSGELTRWVIVAQVDTDTYSVAPVEGGCRAVIRRDRFVLGASA